MRNTNTLGIFVWSEVGTFEHAQPGWPDFASNMQFTAAIVYSENKTNAQYLLLVNEAQAAVLVL